MPIRFFTSILTCFLIPQILAWLGSQPNDTTLHYVAFFAVFIQVIAFLHASGFVFGNDPTERFYDLTGAITYISLVSFTLYLRGGIFTLNFKHAILNAFVLLWALRLGSFLFYRAQKNNGIDSRFHEIKKSWPRFAIVWCIQGVWVFITALPIFYLNSNKYSVGDQPQDLSLLAIIGLMLWLVGFLFESIADWQKLQWNLTPANKHKFINVGLWGISRHPNCTKSDILTYYYYTLVSVEIVIFWHFLKRNIFDNDADFGEIILWIGVYLASLGDFSSLLQATVASVSPIFVTLLLINISGINLLEKVEKMNI